jgi:hypothetical protein
MTLFRGADALRRPEKGEDVLVGILSSETEDSMSRKFEQSFWPLGVSGAPGPALVGLQHCHLMQKNRVSLVYRAASEQRISRRVLVEAVKEADRLILPLKPRLP